MQPSRPNCELCSVHSPTQVLKVVRARRTDGRSSVVLRNTCSSDNKIFEIFTAVRIQTVVFWAATPSGVVVGYQRFGGPCCLHFQGE